MGRSRGNVLGHGCRMSPPVCKRHPAVRVTKQPGSKTEQTGEQVSLVEIISSLFDMAMFINPMKRIAPRVGTGRKSHHENRIATWLSCSQQRFAPLECTALVRRIKSLH